MAFDIDLDQIAAEIGAEDVIERFDFGLHACVTGKLTRRRNTATAEVSVRILQIRRRVMVRQGEWEAADHRRQPIHKGVALQQLDQLGVRLERVNPASAGQPPRDLQGIKADIGADIDEYGVGGNETEQDFEIFFLVAAAIDQIYWTSEIVAIDEHWRLVEQVGQRNAVADIAAQAVSNEVEIAPNPFKRRVDAVEPLAQFAQLVGMIVREPRLPQAGRPLTSRGQVRAQLEKSLYYLPPGLRSAHRPNAVVSSAGISARGFTRGDTATWAKASRPLKASRKFATRNAIG